MNILTELRDRLDRVATYEELNVDATELPSNAQLLGDESVVELLADVAAIVNSGNRLQAILAGVASQRSRREDGHSGLSAVNGHSSPVSLIQAITGGTKSEANRHVRVGTALLEGHGTSTPVAADEAMDAVWHEPLRGALLSGVLTPAQHDAIRVGLGEPSISGDAEPARVRQAWTLAAEQLTAEADGLTVEDLAKRARTVRDILDVVGAEERFARRFESRSFRMWVNHDGQHRASIAFDDEMAAWMRAMIDAGMRPRRGSPRFMTPEERAAADELIDDPRSNEQLEYDLLMDVIRAGSLASAADVFGTRQPGVRMVVVKDVVGPRDALGRLLAVGHLEDGGETVPGAVIDRAVCSHGSLDVLLDATGNPLDLGREQRLYSARQRVTLAIRDGGCLWPGCSRPASYCEAHHCDHFVEDEGRTDIDRGCLLCRFHHMLLHNNGWRIRRDGKGAFVLYPPAGEGDPIVLRSKAAWQWAWVPPPPLHRQSWRTAPRAAGPVGATDT